MKGEGHGRTPRLARLFQGGSNGGCTTCGTQPVPTVFPLPDNGRGYAFPCDGHGRVDIDELSERARNNYFYARVMVGRELAHPAVELAERP